MKQGIAAVVLIVIIIAAVVLIVRQRGSGGKAEAEEKMVTVYDQQGNPVSVKLGDWDKAEVDPATGYKKASGKLLADGITCVACKARIGPAPIAVGTKGDAWIEAMKAYKCPKCGGQPYPAELLNPDLR